MTDHTMNIAGVICVYSDCITCGVRYTVPLSMWEKQRERGGFHSCPNGHSQGWGEDATENAELRRERDRLKQRLAQKDDDIRGLENRNRAAKGQITRMKKRASAGTCPCCKRTFQNVATHVKRQHPDFLEEQGTKVVRLKKRKLA